MGYIGFAIGKLSTKACLSEITYAFSKTLGQKWKNQAKYHPLKENSTTFPCLVVINGNKLFGRT